MKEVLPMGDLLVISDGLIANILRLEGYTIIEVDNPLEALEIAKARENEIAAVVTNVEMEPISGLVLAARLTRQQTRFPVFFMAAPSIARAIVRSLGTNGLIEKPFTTIELTRELGKFLGRAKRANDGRRSEAALTHNSIRANLPAPIRTVFRTWPPP
jgi:DNA-binding response OmpR family regulator